MVGPQAGAWTAVGQGADGLHVPPVPRAQAAAYQLPSCGYADPLGQYTAADLQADLAWEQDINTTFCLEVVREG